MSKRSPSRRPYVVAMLLGSALSAFPADGARGATAAPAERTISEVSRYCTACWRNARLPLSSWGDCTQEVLTRLLERVPGEAWSRLLAEDTEERREFVRAIDAVKKREQRARKWTASSDTVADHRDRGAAVADDREEVCRAAVNLLSPRQQRILQLSFEGWPVHDMARELRLSADRVSDEKYKAVRKLREHLTAKAQIG